MKKRASIDKLFLISTILMTASGFIIFLSASLGLISETNDSFISIAMKQGISLVIGIILFYIFSRLNYRLLKRFSFFIFLVAIIINLLLFIPQISVFHGGASRWLNLGFITFQPSELLKIAFILYLGAWISYSKEKMSSFRYGLLPYIVLTTIVGILLYFQRDTDTLAVILFTGLMMLIIGGARIRHLLLASLLIAGIIVTIVMVRPYALERVRTYLNHNSDTLGSGYQINQSLIAIGSGQTFGRGFGQSIQKFGYLPQPTDDSIFAVAAEEFGFLGSMLIVGLYTFFALSVFRVGLRCHDSFGGIAALGIVILILTESFLNISAMIGIIPLSGLPLLFMSHGGSALIVALGATGIIASISRHD